MFLVFWNFFQIFVLKEIQETYKQKIEERLKINAQIETVQSSNIILHEKSLYFLLTCHYFFFSKLSWKISVFLYILNLLERSRRWCFALDSALFPSVVFHQPIGKFDPKVFVIFLLKSKNLSSVFGKKSNSIEKI